MKFLLNILILPFIISCGVRTEEQRTTKELTTESADTVELSQLLGAIELDSVKSKPKETEPTRTIDISLSSLEPTPCNIYVILYAHENIDSMSTKALDIFLRVFSEECNDNAEFSEFSQEMIFEVFGKYPSEVVELITKKDYNLSALTAELEAPLLDPLIEPIITGITSTGIKNAKIDSVISALERANAYLNGE
ncbi:MAG: hypothetical protein RIG77_17330 [Cyclobacteriaceae bacterium]